MGYAEPLKPRDLNQLAKAPVDQSTNPDDEGDDLYEGKNPAAVELGLLGGKKGREGTRREADTGGTVRDRTEGGEGQVVQASVRPQMGLRTCPGRVER